MPQINIATAGTAKYNLGDGNPDSTSTCVLHVTGGGSFSIVPKAYKGDSTLTMATDAANIAYKVLKTGVVTDGAVTAITAAGLYEIDGNGLKVVLDATYTSGACVVDFAHVRK